MWARGLIEQLLRITHRQWLLRNALLHYKLPDCCTLVQREQLVKRIMELMWTDPYDLLPEDRALLDEDFEKLSAADANDQAYWVAEIESALKAAQHAFDSERTNTQNSTSPGNQIVRQPQHPSSIILRIWSLPLIQKAASAIAGDARSIQLSSSTETKCADDSE